MSEKTRRIRCAVYTRKSHEEGLEQEFNSLDAQREAGESYVLAQRQTNSVIVYQRKVVSQLLQTKGIQDNPLDNLTHLDNSCIFLVRLFNSPNAKYTNILAK